MIKARAGYTIVEVIIVLAVSSAIFVSAVTATRGRTSKTGFFQTVQDVSSKIQGVSSSIKSGNFNDSDNYSCTLDGTGYPVLTSVAPGSGINDDCIVLGRALQVFPGDTSRPYIKIYTVLGNRTVGNTGQVVTSTTNLRPAVATILTDQYNFSERADLLSVRSSGNTRESLGVYSTPESGRFVGVAQTNTEANIAACVRNSFTGGCGAITPVTSWDVCFGESGGVLRQTIVVTVSDGGVATEIKSVASC